MALQRTRDRQQPSHKNAASQLSQRSLAILQCRLRFYRATLSNEVVIHLPSCCSGSVYPTGAPTSGFVRIPLKRCYYSSV